MGKRRKGREVVLQSMYASLISGAELMATLEDQFQQRESADDTVDFARNLATKVKANAEELDQKLNALISDRWDPSRLGTLEVVILTMGLAEILFCPEVPYRVVINEACELTRRYCDEGAVGFVNGVLDEAAARVYPEQKAAAAKEEGSE